MIAKGFIMLKNDKKVATVTALSSYYADDYIQVGDILTDAIELANTPLLERD